MTRVINFLLLFLAAFSAGAQGIHFETGSWQEALQKARQEDKLLFVDMYAVWCGPCKMMEQTIFPVKEVGDKYNRLFVNCKIDAEKGEGIELAQKYTVTAYPTGLYIDPETEKLVYKAVGATDVTGFLQRADDALAEYKDTMTWADYQRQFKAGDHSRKFLVRYIQKAERTGHFADRALDVYVMEYTDSMTDEAFNFLLTYTQTFDNKAAGFLLKHRQMVNLLHAVESPDYFSIWKQRLPYFTFQKAVVQKDETLIDLLYQSVQKFAFPREITGIYNYQKAYYQQIGDSARARKTGFELADYLLELPQSTYDSVNLASKLVIEEKIENQLLSQAIPDSLHAGIIEKTLREHPEYRYNASLSAAQSLNEVAFAVYRDPKASPRRIQDALRWAKKAMDLSDSLPQWAPIADTYAHLLYRSGKRKEAIAIQEQAVARAKASGMGQQKELETALSAMKSGTL